MTRAPEGMELRGDASCLFLGACLEVVGPPRIVPTEFTATARDSEFRIERAQSGYWKGRAEWIGLLEGSGGVEGRI
jgi:hypothetical protein